MGFRSFTTSCALRRQLYRRQFEKYGSALIKRVAYECFRRRELPIGKLKRLSKSYRKRYKTNEKKRKHFRHCFDGAKYECASTSFSLPSFCNRRCTCQREHRTSNVRFEFKPVFQNQVQITNKRLVDCNEIPLFRLILTI